MNSLWNKIVLACFVSAHAMTLYSSLVDPTTETRYLKLFQYADIAGVGTAIAHYDNSLVIDVSCYWVGSFGTNPVIINRAGALSSSTNYYEGKTIVFFAMTNEWKAAVPTRPLLESIIWDDSVTFTNLDGYCQPKFVCDDPPTWFSLDTNDIEHVVFFSNIVRSIVIGKDRDVLYTTLRDAVKSDESGEQPYKGMSFMPLWELSWSDSETNLVEMLNDSHLAPRLRGRALFQLQKRFGWPATNTVPEP